ncbi:carbohydrate kinase family protein [Catenuloplanes atrovinosus]|uniref:Fructokinase n=1 Tax=Catenuloplanes atrovinosus TaxID=137266 RepID=A0AAE4CBC4_9ACTN|nr:carbohydrate kinase [Catenuloplanes atrovinosus]MDR7277948.1 fructokinase [Catenuloplanes atrovinosus]
MAYAVVLGEALIDLLETEHEGRPVYRQVIGGAPLNVATGIARLAGPGHAEFGGALGDDVLAGRIEAFLSDAGVGTRAVARVAAPTALAVATFDGAEPDFRFYGEPPSYALYDDVPRDLVDRAAVLYCGSISLLRAPFVDAARAAWAAGGPLRLFDPNVRPRLLPDEAAWERQRALVTEFAARADLVKLSSVDAEGLYGEGPAEVARRLHALGTPVVVVTAGARGALVSTGDEQSFVPAPVVEAVDATGAGDSVMAALAYRLMIEGRPAGHAGWRNYAEFALSVAALVCERVGGAVAMPTLDDLSRRWAE